MNKLKKGFTPSLENGIALKRGQSPMPFFSAGFTLIELLIVITIIGIISTVILSSLSTSRAKAYDSKIKQQLTSFRTAAEIYLNNQSPTSYGTTVANCITASTLFTDTNVVNGSPGSYILSTNLPPTTQVYCSTNGSAYAVKVTLYGGTSYWCVSNTNISAQYLGTPIVSNVCP